MQLQTIYRTQYRKVVLLVDPIQIHMENQNLICPITLELFVDPVTLRCCGNSFSRTELMLTAAANGRCPKCRANLSTDEVENTPTNRALAYQCEELSKTSVQVEKESIIEPSESSEPLDLTGEITLLPSVGPRRKVGYLELKSDKLVAKYRHLVIVVVDRSGSMGGNPTRNVKYSLRRLVDATYRNPTLLTNIVYYDDCIESYYVDTGLPASQFHQIINSTDARGGTSFTVAFKEIDRICCANASNPLVSNVTVVFLTDGQDCSSISREKQVDILRTQLKNAISVPTTVHSIGFGSGHDFNFLDNLRKAGTHGGVYRFADPNENDDILSSKINSILDVIVQSNAVVLEIMKMDGLITQAESKMQYWVDVTNTVSPLEIVIKIQDENYPLNCEIVQTDDETSKLLLAKWFSMQTEHLITSTIQLSDEDDLAVKKAQARILVQRIRSLLTRIPEDSGNHLQLSKLLTAITLITNNEKVDRARLYDLKAECTFKTTIQSKAKISLPTSTSINTAQISNIVLPKVRTPWKTLNHQVHAIREQLDEMPREIFTYAIKGDLANLKAKLAESCDVEETIEGFGVLDLCVIHGKYKSAALLKEKGFHLHQDAELVLSTCLNRSHYLTSEFLVHTRMARSTETLAISAPRSAITRWCLDNLSTEVDITTAIRNGMKSYCVHNLATFSSTSHATLIREIFAKPSDATIETYKFLVESKIFDANEIFNQSDSKGDVDFSWPLFVAAKHGCVELVEYLIKLDDNINRQNGKGTTALWIACCNQHTDVCLMLLSNGADPNICNHKGDSPLIPAIQKGSSQLVTLLLNANCNIMSYNQNRDNPILIACRIGQAECLELMLQRMSQTERLDAMAMRADIDGLDSILGATEMNKTSCIRVLHKFGADLESTTADNNGILAGATSVHLASHYGNLAALQLLIELGADISKTTFNNSNCLHLAIKAGHPNVIQYLMQQWPEMRNGLDANFRPPTFYVKASGREIRDLFTHQLQEFIEQLILTEDADRIVEMMSQQMDSIAFFDTDILDGVEPFDLDSVVISLISRKPKLAGFFAKLSGEKVAPIARVWDRLLSTNAFPDDALEIDNQHHEMMNRVTTVSKSHLQNGLLLKMKVPTSQPQASTTSVQDITITPSSSSLVEIVDGKKTVLLVSFLEGLSRQPIFANADDRQQLEWAVFFAKVATVNSIAFGETILEPVHLIALNLFTNCAPLVNHVQSMLMKSALSSFYMPFVKCIYQAVDRILPATGECYKMSKTLYSPSCVVGTKIQFNGFMMATRHWTEATDLIEAKSGTIYIIKLRENSQMKPIDAYSRYPERAELLGLPGIQFQVTGLYVGNIVVLGQANIRQTSYAASAINLARASEGTEPIVVELTEL